VKKIVFFILSAILFSACGNRPPVVLSDKKMENVLFDLYIAEAEIRENNAVFFADTLRKQQLLHSVFQKHGISEQIFDISLVWYNANLDKYVKVNNKVAERYSLLIKNLEEERKRIQDRLTVRDTVFLFASPVFMLHPGRGENIRAFHLDSTCLDALQTYQLKLLTIGMNDSIKPILTFCVQYNDTNWIRRDTIRQDGWFTAQYSAPKNRRILSAYGNLHLPIENKMPVLVANLTIYQEKTQLLPIDDVATPVGKIR
jgi:hypothetical protein